MKSTGEVPVDSANDSKPIKEIKQMLNLKKASSKETSEKNNSHTFNPTEMDSEGKKVIVLLYTI